MFGNVTKKLVFIFGNVTKKPFLSLEMLYLAQARFVYDWF